MEQSTNQQEEPLTEEQQQLVQTILRRRAETKARNEHIAALDAVTIKGHDGLITVAGEDGNNPIVFLFTSSSNPDKKTEVQITFESLKNALVGWKEFKIPKFFTALDNQGG